MIARIDLNTRNIPDPNDRLRVALGIIVDTANKNVAIEFVDEEILHKIVVREGAKAYHHKLVDEDNQDGFFLTDKRLCNNIATIISEVREDFPYPKALASTLVYISKSNFQITHLSKTNKIRFSEFRLLAYLWASGFDLLAHFFKKK